MNNATSNIIMEVSQHISKEVSKSIYGYHDEIRLLSAALIIGGHVLLEGPPGIAKTFLGKTFAKSLGLNFNRIQFTPDLMPSDITGVSLFDQNLATFRFSPGPVFADIVLADEINRTPPKTQSALLEAMEEHFVTIDGIRHRLSRHFFVIATQNPIEHEGTFPLPEAQLDRFLFKLNMDYPGSEFEESLIARYSEELPSFDFDAAQSVTETDIADSNRLSEYLTLARTQLREIRLDSSIANYIQRIIEETRLHPDLILGASPRAAVNLALAAKFNAAIAGRNYTVPDDVKQMASVVLAHRLIFQPEFFDLKGRAENTVESIINSVPGPDLNTVSA